MNRFYTDGKVSLINSIDVESGIAEGYYTDIIHRMWELENDQCNDVIINIIDSNGRIIKTNNTKYSDSSVIDTLNPNITRNVHVDFTDNNTSVLNQTLQKVVLNVSLIDVVPTDSETLYLGSSPVDVPYIDE